ENKIMERLMLKNQLLAALCAALLGLTWTGSIIAAEQPSDEILVAMASFKSVCGGNTGRACPGPAPVTAPPPVAASPVIPAPKPSPAPIPSSPSPSAPASPSIATQAPSNITGSPLAVDHTSTTTDDAHAIMSWSHTVGSGNDRV